MVDTEAAQRSLASLDHSLLSHRCSSREVMAASGTVEPPSQAASA